MLKKGLNFNQINLGSLHLQVYEDASFAANVDLLMQLGYLIHLCDSSCRCHILDLISKRVKRVVRSVMAIELYTFIEAFEASATLATDLRKMSETKVSLHTFTDTKQVFDVITHGKRLSERRLAIDVTVARDAYDCFQIDRIELVRGNQNQSSYRTKRKHNGVINKNLFRGMDNTPNVERITRKSASPSLVVGKFQTGL